MPISYDGKRIIHHNVLNYDAYHDYMKRQSEKSQQIEHEQNQRLARQSPLIWRQWARAPFCDATIESIDKHDAKVSTILNSVITESIRDDFPRSLLIGSRAKRLDGGTIVPKGKTWAMYAYMSALCQHHIILDPTREIYILKELDIIDKNTDWTDKGAFMNSVFSSEHKIIVVDDINSDAGYMKRQKYGNDAWGRFISAAQGKHVSFVFLFAGDYDDMSIRSLKEKLLKLTKNAPQAVLEQGVSIS